MRRTTVVLAFGLLLLTFSSQAIGAGNKPAPPQSSAYGHTLAEWLTLYFTWALGGNQANPEGHVYFLPLPSGAEVVQVGLAQLEEVLVEAEQGAQADERAAQVEDDALAQQFFEHGPPLWGVRSARPRLR